MNAPRVRALLLIAATLAFSLPAHAVGDGFFDWFRNWPTTRPHQDPKKASKEAAPAADEEFDEYAAPKVWDPFEPFNRQVFRFNHGLYDKVFRPVARGYEKAVPKPARTGLTNFFDNLRTPIRVVGSLAQFKGRRALAETGKFAVNTTAGLAGFFKVSDKVPALANVPAEDSGQAFGAWGIPHGPYLVLPIIGPATLRDTAGRLSDAALTPLNWRYLNHYEWEVRASAQALAGVSVIPELLATYDSLSDAAIDPYLAARTGYVQFRDAAQKQ